MEFGIACQRSMQEAWTSTLIFFFMFYAENCLQTEKEKCLFGYCFVKNQTLIMTLIFLALSTLRFLICSAASAREQRWVIMGVRSIRPKSINSITLSNIPIRRSRQF